MERHTLLLLVGILILMVLLFLRYGYFIQHYEGFLNAPSKQMAKLPKPEGTSTVPNTMPGAVTRNPTETLASFKDLAALLDVMKTYNTMYEMFLINLVKKTDYTLLHTKSVAYAINLQSQIDTGQIVDKLDFITKERATYENAIKSIRRNEPLYKGENMKKAKKVTKGIVSESGPVKVADLKHAIERATAEQKRIDDIRSESPDFKQRSLILEKIRLDLQQITDKIMRKDMKEENIALDKQELLNFLTNVEDPTSKIKALPAAKPTSSIKAAQQKKPTKINKKKRAEIASNFMDYPEDRKIISLLESISNKKTEGFSNYTNNYIHDTEERDEEFKPNVTVSGDLAKDYKKTISKLRETMRDMSWDMRIDVGYDPNVTRQRRITERLNTISNEIESGRLSRENLRAKFMELEILKQQLETSNRRKISAAATAPDAATEAANKNYGSANTSDNNPLGAKVAPIYEEDKPRPIPGKIGKNGKIIVKQEILTSIEKPLASNDYKIRPGFEMSTEEINKRGSRASFDYTLVGGPDYKKMAKFLCGQIKAAGLGEPKEFGCIANQEEDVGPDYSWKGNYKMVCSRLGNTWGEWYPEMFGCPNPEVSHSQIPKINRDCTPSQPPPPEHPPKPKCGN